MRTSRCHSAELRRNGRLAANLIVILVPLIFGFVEFGGLRGADLPAVRFDRDRDAVVLDGFSGQPSAGVLAAYPLDLPAYEHAVYFATDGGSWPNNANRVLPWFAGSDLSEIFPGGRRQNPAVPHASRNGLFAILALKSGEFLVLLPLAGERTMSWLTVAEDGAVRVTLGTMGTAAVNCDAPLLAWARAADPYTACRNAWAAALDCKPVRGRTTWRSEKQYPEVLRYLGWCSWEQYKLNISSDLLVGAVTALEQSNIPVRWVLVDAGHNTEQDDLLKSFAPQKDKFPQGWKPLLAMRKPDRVRWFGQWDAFYGAYKKGIHRDNDLGPLNREFVSATNGALLPGKSAAGARAYYDALIGSIHDYGFDFVKVDFQAMFIGKAAGTANPTEMHVWNAEALEESCRRLMHGLINCMAMNPACVFNTRYSAVTRCSIDYKLGDAVSAKSHLAQSFHTTLWLGQTVWPDHDMFHSSDRASGRLMAVSKALSGGPVYLSDDPTKFVPELIRPLCFADGLLLRPLAPAVPVRRSLFNNPFAGRDAYVVAAPLPGGAAALVAYNLTEPNVPVRGAFTASDRDEAAAMLQGDRDGWPGAPEGVVLYDWEARKATRLTKPYAFEVAGFDQRLALLCPIRSGWSVIGRVDKYLSPAAAELVEASDHALVVRLHESGPVAIYSAREPVTCVGHSMRAAGDGLYEVELAPGAGPITLRFTR